MTHKFTTIHVIVFLFILRISIHLNGNEKKDIWMDKKMSDVFFFSCFKTRPVVSKKIENERTPKIFVNNQNKFKETSNQGIQLNFS